MSKTKNQQKTNGATRAPRVKSQNKQQPKVKNLAPRSKPARSRNAALTERVTGAGYSQRFDAISSNPRTADRSEDFDELIGTVNGSTPFTTTPYAINPGNPTTFPWLSRIASLFEKYQFEMLEFYFQHDVSQFAAQGQAGLVLLSSLFDAASAPPTNKLQVEATFPHVICMPNQNSLLRIPVSKLHPKGFPHYVRGASLPGGTDIKTYDSGNLFVTTQGMLGAGEVGELHVRGRVRLMDRVLDSSAIAAPMNNQYAVFQSVGGGEPIASGVFTAALLAGTQIGSLGISNNAGVLTLPAGNYLVEASSQFTTANTFFTTDSQISILKNGASIMGSGTPRFAVAAGAACNWHNLMQLGYVSSNGSDTVSLTRSHTFTGGVDNTWAILRITAM
jgi:hypothetical protein